MLRSLLRLLANTHCWGLVAAAAMILEGTRALLTGEDGISWGIPIPAILEVLAFLPAGIILGLISIRALLRGEGKPRPYTDADAEKAKKELDALYRYEHGRPPEAPKEEKPADRKPGSA